ncbi:cache domain-containing protein [Hippea jasoniae]|uniref:cache domain-containing protein n=1 Tax=Hippea jasoniae TaxID=944479 RepID=UPI00068D62CD|nr:cache domain-containing protein [Hippea jasoniae]
MKKISFSKLSILTITISTLIIIITTSLLWDYFSSTLIDKTINFMENNVHLKRLEVLEKNLVDDAIQLANYTFDSSLYKIKETLRQRDYSAYMTALNIYNKYKEKEPIKNIKQRIIDSIKYRVIDKGKGYFFITTLNGIKILSPQKELIGKNLLSIPKYAPSIKQELAVIKTKKEGFVEGRFFHNNKIVTRIAYIKLFKPLGWYIGCGRLLPNFKESTEKEILKEFKLSFGSLKKTNLFVIKLSDNSTCPAKVIFYTDPAFKGHTCIKPDDSYITYPNNKPCIKDCLKKLLNNGSLTVKLIYPFHPKQDRLRITHLRYFKRLNWIVGACSPVHIKSVITLKTTIPNNIRKFFVFTVVFSLFVALIVWVLAILLFIYKPVKNDLKTIENFFKSYRLKRRINTDTINTEEIADISQKINTLVEKLEKRNRVLKSINETYRALASNMPDCMLIFALENNSYIVKNFNIAAKNSPMLDVNKKLASEVTKINNIDKILKDVDKYSVCINFSAIIENEICDVRVYKLSTGYLVGLFKIITERVKLFKYLQQSKAQLSELINNIKTGIILVNRKGEIVLSNHFSKELLGFKEKINIEEIDLPISLKAKFVKVLKDRDICEGCQVNLTTADGKSKWFDVYTSKITLNNENYIIISFNDITQRYIKSKQLEYLSFHDTLTGLYNRHYFEEEIKRLFNKRSWPLGLVLLDLNGLKIINDILGHEMGDRLLKKLAEILSTSARSTDIVARIGGDEFAVLMPNTDENGIKKYLERVKEKIKKNNDFGDTFISVSWGWTVYSGQFKSYEELFREADKHMFKDKYSKDRISHLKEIIKWTVETKKGSIDKKLEEYFLNR